MTDDERVLLEHRAAVRVNLPADAAHTARTARRLVDVASYARLPMPGEVLEAVTVLERWSAKIAEQVNAEGAERERRGLGLAAFQRELERAARLTEGQTTA